MQFFYNEQKNVLLEKGQKSNPINVNWIRLVFIEENVSYSSGSFQQLIILLEAADNWQIFKAVVRE